LIEPEELSWVWGYTLIVPALGKLRQENQEFEVSLGNIITSFLKKKKN
jgi:hypothetical protein